MNSLAMFFQGIVQYFTDKVLVSKHPTRNSSSPLRKTKMARWAQTTKAQQLASI